MPEKIAPCKFFQRKFATPSSSKGNRLRAATIHPEELLNSFRDLNVLPLEVSMASNVLFLEIDKLRHRWGWFLVLGIVLVCLGVIALLMTPVATFAAVLVLGWLMLASGIIEIVQAFRLRGWGGVFLHLIAGILGVLVGLLVITHPVAGALAWTLLFASFLTVVGLFRIISAVQLRFPNWGWAVFDGAITLLLGIMVWVSWPWSGLWFLGVSLGITFVMRGWSYIMLAVALRRVPPVARVLKAA